MDNGNNNTDKAHGTFLFQHLVVMFQTLALQQMGKLTSPLTGKVERDLHQAKITVDMLGMIQKKTEGNLDENEERILDTARAEKEEEEGGTADEEKENEVEEDSDAGEEEEKPTGNA